MKETHHKSTKYLKSKAHEKNGFKSTQERPMKDCHLFLKTFKTAIGLRLHNNNKLIQSEIQRNEGLGCFSYCKERSEDFQNLKVHMKSIA